MNYKKDLTKVLPIDQKLSIIYKLNLIEINNFTNIYDIKNNTILIDNYQINGDFLKITTIENRCIQIDGTIKEIKIL